MSIRHVTSYEAVLLQYRCHRCHAKRGDWCTTAAGNNAGTLHSSRIQQAHKATARSRRGMR